MEEKEIVFKSSGPKFKEATDAKGVQNYVTHCWKDNDISKHNFNQIMKWKNIPAVVLTVHKSILQELVYTRVYRVKKPVACLAKHCF